MDDSDQEILRCAQDDRFETCHPERSEGSRALLRHHRFYSFVNDRSERFRQEPTFVIHSLCPEKILGFFRITCTLRERTAIMQQKAVVLLSGGLDSSTVLAIAHQQGFELYAIAFDYG